MNTRRPVRNIAQAICAVAFVCAAAGASAQTVSSLDVASALASNSAISSRSAAMVDAREAVRRLEQARLEREQGAQALPRERTRGANSRALNHRYWQRQEKLRRMVEQALHRSNEARPPQRVRRAARGDHQPRNETLARDVTVSH